MIAAGVLAASEHQIKPSLILLVVAAVLVACGVYLLLERALTRVLLGVVLMSNGVAALYMVASGPAKGAALVGERSAEEMSDPLPQAMVLTAIVISLATVAFVCALAYRQWQMTGSDDVPDDAEDAVIKRLAASDRLPDPDDDGGVSTTTAEEEPDEAELGEGGARP